MPNASFVTRYSHRSAVIGSIFAALRAGTYVAASADASNTSKAIANVEKSPDCPGSQKSRGPQ
jgi:hypothetical protein